MQEELDAQNLDTANIKSGHSFKSEIIETIKLVLIAFVLSWVLRSYVIEARIIPSGSMLPTIQLQDRVLVDKIFYRFSKIHEGDVIVFQPPIGVTTTHDDFIKRVIGLPNDTIEVKNGAVLVNGEALQEPYIAEKPNYNFGPIKVPNDSYFVMGDNRNDSLDSHIWGTLPAKNVLGRTLFRYWPLRNFGPLAK